MTFAEACDEVASVIGHTVKYTQIPLEAFTSALTAQGVPENAAGLMNFLFTMVLDGRNAHLTDGIQRALGREPGDFREYAKNAVVAWQKENIHHG